MNVDVVRQIRSRIAARSWQSIKICFSTCAASFVALLSSSTFALPGTLDVAFGRSGKVVVSVSQMSHANAMAVQIDGKIVLAGTCSTEAGSAFCMARLRVNGALDATFGQGGVVLDNGVWQRSDARAVVIDSLNRILVTGTCSDANVIYSQMCVRRYRTDGTVDPTFSNSGSFQVAEQSRGNALAIHYDGSIVIAGDCAIPGTFPRTFRMCVARLNANGAPRYAFGINAVVYPEFYPLQRVGTFAPSSAKRVAIDGNGALVVVGGCVDELGLTHFCAARIDHYGFVERTQPGAEYTGWSAGVDSDGATGLQIRPDGRVALSGHARSAFSDFPSTALTGLFGDFRPERDGSFSYLPIVQNTVSNTGGLALQGDAKPVIAGTCSVAGGASAFCVTRATAVGALDMSFGTAGTARTSFYGFGDVATSVAVQADGKILVAGHCRVGNETRFCVARYLHE
jgi:uncharacterized delta-60 repeat protein